MFVLYGADKSELKILMQFVSILKYKCLFFNFTEDLTLYLRILGEIGHSEKNMPVKSQIGTLLLDRPLVLVGLMGCGKTSIGRRVASRLQLPFFDADAEIEYAAGRTIPEIFDQFGEDIFRERENKVMARLLEGSPCIISSGGGAFIAPQTRCLIKKSALSLWLRAELPTLIQRCARRNNRPLLRDGDPGEILNRLMVARHPIYAEADLMVQSENNRFKQTVEKVLAALRAYRGGSAAEPHGKQAGVKD